VVFTKKRAPIKQNLQGSSFRKRATPAARSIGGENQTGPFEQKGRRGTKGSKGGEGGLFCVGEGGPEDRGGSDEKKEGRSLSKIDWSERSVKKGNRQRNVFFNQVESRGGGGQGCWDRGGGMGGGKTRMLIYNFLHDEQRGGGGVTPTEKCGGGGHLRKKVAFGFQVTKEVGLLEKD